MKFDINLKWTVPVPEPELVYSRSDRHWTAYRDDLRMVAGGRTKKEVLENWKALNTTRLLDSFKWSLKAAAGAIRNE